MEINTHKTQDGLLVEMDGEMNIYNAISIKEELFPFFSQPENIEINLSRVRDIDSAGVQLLILAKREISKSGRELRLTNHSRVALEMFELYNLAAYFGDPVLISDSASESVGV